MRADGSPNRRQFLITTALVTALSGFLLVTSIVGVVDDLHIRDQEAAQEAGLRARILGDNAARAFSDVQRTLIAGAGANSAEQLAAFIAGNNTVRSAAVFDEAGHLRRRTTPQNFMATVIADQPMFETLHGETKFGLFVVNRPRDNTQIPLAAARIDTASGEFAGVVVAELGLDNFQSFYRAAARTGAVALLGHLDRVIVAWPPPDGSWVGKTTAELPAFAGILPRGVSDDVVTEAMKSAHIATARRTTFGGMVLVAVPRPAMGMWDIARQPAIVFASVVALIAFALLAVLHRLSLRHEQSSAALRASEDQAARQLAELESLYNTALVGLAFVDKDLRYRRINAHLARINGLPQEAHIGRTLGELIPELSKVIEPVYRRVLESGERIVEQEISGTTPADPENIRTWLMNYHPIRGSGDDVIGVNVVVQDVTERRRSVATERRLLDAIEHMSEGLALWDAEDRLVFCNERYRQLSRSAGPMLVPGVTFTELLRRSIQAGLLDDAVGREEEWLAQRLFRHRHPTEAIETKREGRWLRVYEHLVPDGGVIVALNDIHAQKLQEEQLRQAQKMEAVGHLTGGVAHDFNNLLAVIVGNLELLEERNRPNTAERDMLAAALRAAHRGAELTQRLLAFARQQPLTPEITDPRQLIDELVPMLRRTLGETFEIVSRATPDLGNVTADRGQLENVLINLCLNARDAMPKGGTLVIDLYNLDLDSDYADRQEDVRPGPYVVIAVSDNGLGMDAETKRRAFEPFFTTKEVGKGSGLGLSTAYGFAKQSNGHITLYSELGHGTTVKLYFPRAGSKTVSPLPAPRADAASHAGNETILLVEDDADVRALAASVLNGLGYRVLQAANGATALDVLEGAGPIDLLLTDVILPGGMLGPTLAAEIERQRPGTRVLYMSGYTEDALIHGGRLDEGVELISKPFRKAELAAKIRSVLRGGRG